MADIITREALIEAVKNSGGNRYQQEQFLEILGIDLEVPEMTMTYTVTVTAHGATYNSQLPWNDSLACMIETGMKDGYGAIVDGTVDSVTVSVEGFPNRARGERTFDV